MRVGRTTARALGAVALAALMATGAVGAANGSAQSLWHPADKADRTKAVRAAVQGGTAKNVILLIGDGMGDSEITIARNYAKGADGRLEMDQLPLTGDYTTYAVQQDDPTKPDYVTDSAASGTGWATGYKSYNGAISVNPYGTPEKTILELAKKAGYRTGDVSTAELTDATPAVQVAHVSQRGCQGPADMATCADETKQAGGLGSIAEQSVESGVDVLLGGGADRYNQKITGGAFKGKTVVAKAKAAGYTVATDRASLRSTKAGQKVLGLFSGGNMPLAWNGPLAKVGGTVASRCTTNNDRGANVPQLAEMTSKAIDLLTAKNAGRGFFLQVEGASIDKQDHAANPCGQIGETVEFDKSIKVARAFAAKNPDTLIVVTADHGHTSQIIPNGTASPGETATLITADDAEMTINYATNTPGESQEHTGTQVRIAAQGPQAANVVGLTDQTDLFDTITRALALRTTSVR
jgi:alkaline phosphatase